MILGALFTIFGIILIYFLWQYSNGNHQVIEGILGPSLLEIVSCVLKRKKDVLTHLHSIHDKYGPTFCLHIKPFSPIVITSDHNYFCQILASKEYLHKSSGYDCVSPMFAGSLVCINRIDIWTNDRKILNEAFGHESFKVFLEQLDQEIHKLEGFILEKINGPVDMEDILHKFILQTSVVSVVDPNIPWDHNRNNEFKKSLDLFMVNVIKKQLALSVNLDFLFNLTKNHAELQNDITIIKQYAMDMVDAHLQNIDKQSDPNNIIYRLYEAGVPYDRIVDNVILFIIAAHETVATTLSYCIFDIAKHHDVQNKMCAEINGIKRLNGINATISIRDIQHLKYIQSVLKESLRTRPVISYIMRKLHKPAVVNNVIIPEGTNMVFFIDALHKSEKYFKDPLIFNPDRFSAENKSNLVANTFAPFSLGIRNCIGKSLAMQKMKFILARLLDRFEFSPVVPEYVLDIRSAILAKSLNGVPVLVKVRGSNGYSF